MGGLNVIPATTGKVACKGGREVSIMGASVQYAIAQADDRAQLGISRAREANNFPTDSVLLCRERESGKGGGTYIGIGGKEEVKATVANTELDITEPKRSGFARGNGVFAGTKEVKESNAAHVGNSHVARGRGSMGDGHDTAKDLDWDRLDPVGRRIFLFIGGEHTLNAEVNVTSGG
jgi:hypothetical protein